MNYAYTAFWIQNEVECWCCEGIEGLGAPSQKTSLLGGVAQILTYPRPSPCLTDVGLFVRPKSQQSPPQIKSLPVSSTIFTPADQMLHWDTNFFSPCGIRASNSVVHITVKFSRAQLALQGPIAPFCAIGWSGLLRLCVIGGIYIVEYHPHTRLSSGHVKIL